MPIPFHFQFSHFVHEPLHFFCIRATRRFAWCNSDLKGTRCLQDFVKEGLQLMCVFDVNVQNHVSQNIQFIYRTCKWQKFVCIPVDGRKSGTTCMGGNFSTIWMNVCNGRARTPVHGGEENITVGNLHRYDYNTKRKHFSSRRHMANKSDSSDQDDLRYTCRSVRARYHAVLHRYQRSKQTSAQLASTSWPSWSDQMSFPQRFYLH